MPQVVKEVFVIAGRDYESHSIRRELKDNVRVYTDIYIYSQNYLIEA